MTGTTTVFVNRRQRIVLGLTAVVALVAMSVGATAVGHRLSGSDSDNDLAALLGDGGGYVPPSSNAARSTVVAPAAVVGEPATDPPVDVAEPSAALAADHRNDPRRLMVLVITADVSDPTFVAMRAALAQIGVPNDVLVTTTHILTEKVLWDGDRTGNYQAVMLASNLLLRQDPASSQFVPTFSEREMTLLRTYERSFGVREVVAAAYPDGSENGTGLTLESYDDVGSTTENATLTDAGRKEFSYLNPAARIPIRFTWVYRARAMDDKATTPLVVDRAGHPLVAVTNTADGRETLTATISFAQNEMGWLVIQRGIVGWVTKGIYLGETLTTLNVQIDDLFLIGALWDIELKTNKSGKAYRMNADDLTNLKRWQDSKRTSPQLADLRLEWAYNGYGATLPEGKALAKAALEQKDDWNFLNHTWAHRDLDALNYSEVVAAITQNVDFAETAGYTNFSSTALVQPNISGLKNSEFLKGASAAGVRYLVSDTSRPEWNNPSPNAGFYSQLEPSVLVVPRHTTDLFADVSTVEEWVSEFNHNYGPNGVRATFDHDFTYQEILDSQAELMVKAMVKGDIDPWMFHQPNVRSLENGRSLLSDLLDTVFEQYLSYYRAPITTTTLHSVGAAMADRMAYDAAKVEAVYTPCTGISLRAEGEATVPITGGGKVSRVRVDSATPVTVTAPAC